MATPSSNTQAVLRDLLSDSTWLEHFQTEARSRLRTAYQQTTFHTPTPGYYRLCFATDAPTVRQAINRLTTHLG